jgi:prespore-specific regulator
MKVRSDAWSHEDDLLLAETVLRYVREGGTQLQAFEEVGDKLNRTSAACGFRWNAEVRKQYEKAMQLAKKQRKERKRALTNATSPSSQNNRISVPSPSYKEEISEELTTTSPITSTYSEHHISIDGVISFLTELKNEDRNGVQLKRENERLKLENTELKRKCDELQRKVQNLSKEQQTIQEDYQALVQIMDRARRMVMFDESEEKQAPVFKMDKNGNLEKVAK